MNPTTSFACCVPEHARTQDGLVSQPETSASITGCSDDTVAAATSQTPPSGAALVPSTPIAEMLDALTMGLGDNGLFADGCEW